MSDVRILKKNEIYIKLKCEPHILYELQRYFTFEVPGAKFMPQMRSKHWDGQIRLLSVHTGEIYVGLLDKVIDKLKLHGYTYEFENNKYYGLPFEINEEITKEGDEINHTFTTAGNYIVRYYIDSDSSTSVSAGDIFATRQYTVTTTEDGNQVETGETTYTVTVKEEEESNQGNDNDDQQAASGGGHSLGYAPY